jgi:hypothetical protein
VQRDAQHLAHLRLPEACKMEIEVAVSMSGLVRYTAEGEHAADRILAQLLRGFPCPEQVVSAVVSLTKTGKSTDFSRLATCQPRSRGSFTAILSGQINADVPGNLRRFGWQPVEVDGDKMFARMGNRPPFIVQAEDGSLLIASRQAEVRRAIASSRQAMEPPDASETETMHMTIHLPESSAYGPPGAVLQGALLETYNANFQQRRASAAFLLASRSLTEGYKERLRGALESAVDGKLGRQDPGSLYLSRHARLTVNDRTVTADSDLDDDAIRYLTDEAAAYVGSVDWSDFGWNCNVTDASP